MEKVKEIVVYSDSSSGGSDPGVVKIVLLSLYVAM